MRSGSYRHGHGPYKGIIKREMVRIFGRAQLEHTLTKSHHVSAALGSNMKAQLIKVLLEDGSAVPSSWTTKPKPKKKSMRR